MRALIAILGACLLCVPAAAQTTRPTADPAKENAELRAYVDRLEARIAELEAKVQAQAKRSPHLLRPPLIAPHAYQLPAPPFKLPALPSPAPAPAPNIRILPAPSKPIPDTWRRHEFNGQEFYLIPLR